ncbi:ras-related protein Rap-1b-like [Penaeus chinensis]|uniref:ras-related protein Rap-1b-like n=1 Tax=Penaeus chinensis TaxID=139456 RepID=UPI001FB6B1A2|nr:ras-related protein Rap-1b-like [Penaeus chinensis]
MYCGSPMDGRRRHKEQEDKDCLSPVIVPHNASVLKLEYGSGMWIRNYADDNEDKSQRKRICGERHGEHGLFHALEILDTAGSHHFPAMRELSIRSGRAFVIVFAVNNEQSFYEAQSLWNLITKIKGSDGAPVVVVGNKVDLDRERVVSFQRAQDWVDTDMSNASYLETSAKYNINVGELFKQLLIRTYGLANNEMAPTGARGRLKSLGNIMEVVRRRSFSLAQAASCSAIPDHPDIRDQKCAIL